MLSTMVGQLPGHVAAADYTAKQYYLVYVSAANVVTLGGAGAVCAGVLINKPDSGIAADVFGLGEGEVILGGTVAANDPLKCDAAGKAVKADTDKDHTIGYTRVAGVAGDIVKALIVPGSLAHA